ARTESLALVARLTGRRLPPEMIDEIVARTDGVPLFAEELTKAVLESGDTSVPASLHDSLKARLDRSSAAKEVAQIAACIGRQFDQPLLAAVSGKPPSELETALDALVRAEIIFRRRTVPVAQYFFKHALVQDAAYESLLHARRQQLHARILEALETQPADCPPDTLAHHATRAGMSGKAIDYWQHAGDAAVHAAAFQEAVSHFSNAIELIEAGVDAPDRRERELAIQLRLGHASAFARGSGSQAAKTAFDRAYALYGTVDDRSVRMPLFHGVWSQHYARAELPRSLEVAQEFLAAAQGSSDSDDAALLALAAYRALGSSCLTLGNLAQARRHFDRALEIYDRGLPGAPADALSAEIGVAVCCQLGWTLCLLGHAAQGAAFVARAQSLSGAAANVSALASGHVYGVLTAVCMRDVAAASHHAESLILLAEKHRLPQYLALARGCRAWTLFHEGHARDAVPAFEEALAELAVTGLRLWAPYLTMGLASALAACGRDEDARFMIRQAIAECDQTSQRWCLAEAWRVRGELLLGGSPPEPAEAVRFFERAMAMARSQQARLWELRAAVSLARAWRHEGRRAEAHAALAARCASFTEGAVSTDLAEAAALLHELAA
ncbi:MAG TPA: hypothetical protein VIO33_18385, partial [Burkholderiaceae bacterium]